MGRSWGGSAPPLPEVGRGAAREGALGAAESGFRARVTQGAGRSREPARRGRCQRRLCSLQEGRAAARAQRPVASAELGRLAPSGLGRPARWSQGKTRAPVARAPPARLASSHSATSCRRNERSWFLLWLLWVSALLSAAIRTRAETGKLPGRRVAPAASAPRGSWFWRRARLQCAPHSWT